MKVYETRDIIYGFITYDDWEREIINHPVFQRLRRIKQLSLTDMIYPHLKKYIDYDDWKMYGLIKEGLGGEHGKIILERSHDKCVYQTSEVPDETELDRFEDLHNTFQNEISFVDSSEKSWYKTGKEDIFILCDSNKKNEKLEPLSKKSSIVRNLQPIKQKRLYVKNESRLTVKKKIRKYLEGKK